MSTAESKVQANVRALRELGITVGPVWSPADTLADTRYTVDDGTGTRILFHREVPGFIAGVRAAYIEATAPDFACGRCHAETARECVCEDPDAEAER